MNLPVRGVVQLEKHQPLVRLLTSSVTTNGNVASTNNNQEKGKMASHDKFIVDLVVVMDVIEGNEKVLNKRT